MIRVYGLNTCDTCRRALKWLAAEGIEHRFRDLRADGLDGERLGRWIGAAGWEALLNRRSTTWRGLAERDKAGLDAARARALMAAHPALIKRPVFELPAALGGAIVIGFADDAKARLRTG